MTMRAHEGRTTLATMNTKNVMLIQFFDPAAPDIERGTPAQRLKGHNLLLHVSKKISVLLRNMALLIISNWHCI